MLCLKVLAFVAKITSVILIILARKKRKKRKKTIAFFLKRTFLLFMMKNYIYIFMNNSVLREGTHLREEKTDLLNEGRRKD